jgi:hypothetical protein
MRVTPFWLLVPVVCLAVGSSACERYELANTPSNLAFGRLEATFSPGEARLLGRSPSCPASQPFLWTHRVELRETGGVAATVVDWQASEALGSSVFSSPQRPGIATLNQCGPVTAGRIPAGGTVCGDVNFCGTAVTIGRRIEHRFYTVDDNGVPNTTPLDVPLAAQ